MWMLKKAFPHMQGRAIANGVHKSWFDCVHGGRTPTFFILHACLCTSRAPGYFIEWE
jgi:hypothetical protein